MDWMGVTIFRVLALQSQQSPFKASSQCSASEKSGLFDAMAMTEEQQHDDEKVVIRQQGRQQQGGMTLPFKNNKNKNIPIVMKAASPAAEEEGSASHAMASSYDDSMNDSQSYFYNAIGDRSGSSDGSGVVNGSSASSKSGSGETKDDIQATINSHAATCHHQGCGDQDQEQQEEHHQQQ